MVRPSIVWFLWGVGSVILEGLLGRQGPLDPELSLGIWFACCIGFGALLGLLRWRLPGWVAFCMPAALVFPEVLRAAGLTNTPAVVLGFLATFALGLAGWAWKSLDSALPALLGFGLVAASLLRPVAQFHTSAEGSPRVLLISVDTVRADSGLLDDPAFAPEMGFHHYQNAYSAAPWTLPSMLSVLWGEPVSSHGGGLLGPQGPGRPRPPERVWGGLALLSNPWLSPARGFDQVVARLVHEETSREPLLVQHNVVGFLSRWAGVRSTAKRNLDQRLELATIRAIQAGESAIWVHLLAPHEYARECEACDPTEKKRRYQELVFETRQRLVRIVQAAPDYVVVILGDHGEAFGESGVWGHGHHLQDAELHVPLAIRIPGEPGRVHPELVGTVEIGSWILQLQGCELSWPSSAPEGRGRVEVAGARGQPGQRAERASDGRYHVLPPFQVAPAVGLSREEEQRLRAFGYLDGPSP